MTVTSRLQRVLLHPVSVVSALFGLGSLIGLLGPLQPLAAFIWANAGSVATIASFARVFAAQSILPLPTEPLTALALALSAVVTYKSGTKLLGKFREQFTDK